MGVYAEIALDVIIQIARSAKAVRGSNVDQRTDEIRYPTCKRDDQVYGLPVEEQHTDS